MIREFKIKNFKSVNKLKLELGRVNIFIGANGSGKTNILEGLALASAAANNKLDHEFFASRGIRSTEPNLMKSGFSKDDQSSPIEIQVESESEGLFGFSLDFENSKWIDLIKDKVDKKFVSLWESEVDTKKIEEDLKDSQSKDFAITLFTLINKLYVDSNEKERETMKELFLHGAYTGMKEKYEKEGMLDFLIYSPENSALRTFEKEGQILPLGINGEGLFKIIKNLYQSEDQKDIETIQGYLQLIDWFQDFEVPKDLFGSEATLKITDSYMEEGLKYFDQRSANEGFLFLLFYFTLLIHSGTPKFFAIDNIDNALNPKLAIKLITSIASITKERDKQVILTTHNPAVLDGLNLEDDEQRLFTVYRNLEGHTVAKRFIKPKGTNKKEPVKLSEAFLRGYIGGLPNNF